MECIKQGTASDTHKKYGQQVKKYTSIQCNVLSILHCLFHILDAFRWNVQNHFVRTCGLGHTEVVILRSPFLQDLCLEKFLQKSMSNLLVQSLPGISFISGERKKEKVCIECHTRSTLTIGCFHYGKDSELNLAHSLDSKLLLLWKSQLTSIFKKKKKSWLAIQPVNTWNRSEGWWFTGVGIWMKMWCRGTFDAAISLHHPPGILPDTRVMASCACGASEEQGCSNHCLWL